MYEDIMESNGITNHLNGTWVNITKGKNMFGNNKEKEKVLRKYIVMTKFKDAEKFLFEKGFITSASAQKYVEALIETKDYKDMEYFLFEQSKDYQLEEKEINELIEDEIIKEQEVVNG